MSWFFGKGTHIPEVDRGVPAGRALAAAKAFHGPDRFDTAFRRRNFGDGPLPLRANLVAIVTGAVDALTDELRRRHRGVLRELAFFFEQRAHPILDFVFALRVEEFFLQEKGLIESNRI